MPETSVLTVARQKKSRGQALTLEEARALKDYDDRYVKLSVKVYFETTEQLATYRELAKAQQFRSFSAWILSMIKLGASGKMVDVAVLERLERQLEKSRLDFEHERNLAEDYRKRASQLETEMEPMRRQTEEHAAQLARLTEEYSKVVRQVLRGGRK